ncbi:MAG: DNA-protecting protein DprA [Chlorobi bacterium]|nr:DNA-protecting protein DprA [Chlorobiota bacterium]
MNSDDLKYKMALAQIPGLGPVNAKNLISYCGGIKEIFNTSEKKLLKTPGIGKITARSIIQSKQLPEDFTDEIKFITKNNIQFHFYLDNDYPFLLKQCPDAPLFFFKKGTISSFDNRKIISVVGTRNATQRGKEICKNLIKELSESGHNPIIISGLAFGIDICAHKAALKYGLETVSVLAHGFDRIYPAKHKNTASEITKQGALITEFTKGSKFERQNFLRRNRIIAGLSHASIIIESAAKGGSLVTADIANSYNRDVFAVPGRLDDKYSEGTNWLIKIHKAFLLQSAKDIEYILNWEQNINPKQQVLFVELSEDEKKIAEILQTNSKAVIDYICKESGFNSAKTSALLLEMEFKNAVRCLPGKVFELTGNINIK